MIKEFLQIKVSIRTKNRCCSSVAPEDILKAKIPSGIVDVDSPLPFSRKKSNKNFTPNFQSPKKGEKMSAKKSYRDRLCSPF